MKFLFVVLATALLLPTDLYAAGPRCLTFFGLDPVSRFETDVEGGLQPLKRIRIEAEEILEVKGRIATGQAYAAGVLRVRTRQGIFAFKIYNEHNPLQELASTIVIQNEFARRGLSPKVHGVMSAKNVAKFLRNFPEAKSLIQDPDVSFGVLMDEVPIVSHITAGEITGARPASSRPALDKRVQEIENAFTEMRILIPEDLQLVFDRNQQLWLLDFDSYVHFTSDGRVVVPFGNPLMTIRDYVDSNSAGAENKRLMSQENFKVRLTGLRKILGL